MYQFGRFGAGNIRAWRGVVEASRGFAARWNPASRSTSTWRGGPERSSANLGTFRTKLILSEWRVFGTCRTSSGRSNSIRLEPTLTLAPRRMSPFDRWGFLLARERARWIWYGIPGNLIVRATSTRPYEGSSPIAEVAWTLNPHLSVHLDYIFVSTDSSKSSSVHRNRKTES